MESSPGGWGSGSRRGGWPTKMTTLDSSGSTRGGLREKPPIWQPPPKKPMTATEWVIGIAVILVFAGFGWMLTANYFEETTDARRVVVRVVGVAAGHPHDNGRRSAYAHVVETPDGERAEMVSQRLFAVGTRMRVTLSRGMTSGRLVASPPYEPVPEEVPPSFDGVSRKTGE